MTSILTAVWLQAFSLNASHCHFDGLPSPVGQVVQDPTDEIRYIGGVDRYGAPVGNFWFEHGGWFVVHLKVSLMPGSGASSFTWEQTHPTYSGVQSFITPFTATGDYTHHAGSIIFKAEPQTAYRLGLAAPSGAVINPDPRASKLTIYKLGG